MNNPMPIEQYFELELKVINDYKHGLSTEELMDKYSLKEHIVSLMIECYEKSNFTETIITIQSGQKRKY